MHNVTTKAADALEKLKEGNRNYLHSQTGSADISPAARLKTYEHGQSPYAVIIACSDSRVIPESIFSAGIGDLFVIRVAGNVIGDHQLGSIAYAIEHLGCRLIVVLGHTRCGAVGAAMEGEPGGYVQTITDLIRQAIGNETDDFKAGCLNVMQSVSQIMQSLDISNEGDEEPYVAGAIYRTDSGLVQFL